MDREFVLGVDLDGVCADFTPALRRAFGQWRGVDPATLPEHSSFYLAEWGVEPGEYERVHRHAVTHLELFADLPVVPGAPQALRRLSDLGIRIRVITHRLYVPRLHAQAVTQTVTWLDRHAIPYWDLCFMRDKAMVDADLYVDDAVHNIEALQEAGREVIAFSAPYNRRMDPPPVLRADDWQEVERLVRERYAAWPSAA